ncbi:MAG: hypothetical protein HON32_05175 [Francisellaceae bacterium]|jgi:hypothetical protein|nr:hypothetical protein [Francisellaceae bacterium]MBT6538332.1 hypothetical protein [Francisellaceae bacterium]
MPTRLINNAEKVVKDAQQSLKEQLFQRLEALKALHETPIFDDTSGDGLARMVKSEIKSDANKLETLSEYCHSQVVQHWNEAQAKTVQLIGNDEDAICRISEGTVSIPDNTIMPLATSTFWGTEVPMAFSYLSWAIEHSMTNFAADAIAKNTGQQTINLGGFRISLSADPGLFVTPTSIFSANTLNVRTTSTLSNSFRLSKSPNVMGAFHSGFNLLPDHFESSSLPSEFDVIERSLQLTHPGHTHFYLTLQQPTTLPEAGDIVQRNGHFCFMYGGVERNCLAPNNSGYAQTTIPSSELGTSIYRTSIADPENSALTLKFRST